MNLNGFEEMVKKAVEDIDNKSNETITISIKEWISVLQRLESLEEEIFGICTCGEYDEDD